MIICTVLSLLVRENYLDLARKQSNLSQVLMLNSMKSVFAWHHDRATSME